jgi:hypothetical protein
VNGALKKRAENARQLLLSTGSTPAIRAETVNIINALVRALEEKESKDAAQARIDATAQAMFAARSLSREAYGALMVSVVDLVYASAAALEAGRERFISKRSVEEKAL